MKFYCDFCHFGAQTRKDVRAHIHYAHFDENLVCRECNMKFTMLNSLRKHIARHNERSTLPMLKYATSNTINTQTLRLLLNEHLRKEKIMLQKEFKQEKEMKSLSDQTMALTHKLDTMTLENHVQKARIDSLEDEMQRLHTELAEKNRLVALGKARDYKLKVLEDFQTLCELSQEQWDEFLESVIKRVKEDSKEIRLIQKDSNSLLR